VDELIADARRTRAQAARLRAQAFAHRRETERRMRRARRTLRVLAERRERLVFASPWSELPWRLPPPDLRDVLVPLPGGQADRS